MTGPLSVLYVEDEPDIREIVALALSLDPDMRLTLANGGPQALERVEADTFDVILLDMMMPGMDGAQTLSRLSERLGTACPPVIFVTARAQAREVEWFRSQGAIDVIIKPFDAMTLAAEVRAILARQGRG